MSARYWVAVAALGFVAMLWAFRARPQLDARAPWGSGAIVIGPLDPGKKDLPGPLAPVSLRLLPATETAEAMITVTSSAAPDVKPGLEARLRPKLVMMPLSRSDIDAQWLKSGRMPAANGEEVLAGAKVRQAEMLSAGGRSLKVVGVLVPDVALFAESYLIPTSETANALFAASDPSVRQAALLRLSAEESANVGVLRKLAAAFPRPKYAIIMPSDRLDSRTFYIYLAGQAVLLFAGSGALIGLYRFLATRARWAKAAPQDEDDLAEPEPSSPAHPLRAFLGELFGGFFAEPLREIQERHRLLWGVHITYFSLVMLGSLFIYKLPDVQATLGSLIENQLTSGQGPLRTAAKAYETGSILRAAVVTFVINFFLGSLLMLTLPSVILPGCGTFVAALRAFVWGFLLAPTFVSMAHRMLPHSGTMLLEGEGYILATFFALLIPIHLFQSSLGGTPLSRFGRVLLLNVKANVLVALVLAVAACYEATEVIKMM